MESSSFLVEHIVTLSSGRYQIQNRYGQVHRAFTFILGKFHRNKVMQIDNIRETIILNDSSVVYIWVNHTVIGESLFYGGPK